jgi:23S rRNA pseudouridine955/2504/2580 synthase
MDKVRMLEVAPGEEDSRLDRWLKRRWPHLNHVQIHKLTRSGQIRVDGARVKPETRLTVGAQVRVPPLPDPPERGQRDQDLSPRDAAFARSLVLYEDDEVLALNKPSGLAVQGGAKTTRHIDGLLGVWGTGVERPRLAHRLDRDTTGVLVLGKTPAAAASLAGAFAKRRAEKTYWAIVAGQPRPAQGLIALHLAKKGVGDREMVVPVAPKDFGAEAAETDYATVSHAANRASWLALRPHTGRTHQLRVHMQAIGHPILGDPKYGDASSAALSEGLKLQLHARCLSLPHPGGGMLVIEAPLSPQMQAGFQRFGFEEGEADPEPFRAAHKRR